MKTIDYNYFRQAAAETGFCINEYELDMFDRFAAFMTETNKVMNITAITEPHEIVVKHFLDSLLVLRALTLPKGSRMADVGTGGGFPGVPVKIVRPDIRLTLIDSLKKRVNYLGELSLLLGQENTCVHMRAEDAGKKSNYREHFDFVTARAVADLAVLGEYCLPLVKVGGRFAALKGPDCEAEIQSAQSAIEKLGGKILATEKFTLPDGAGRSVVVIEKISQTPTIYPRIAAKIGKIPL